jgi:hypothetical protein
MKNIGSKLFILLILFNFSCSEENGLKDNQLNKKVDKHEVGNSYFVNLNSDKLQDAVSSYEYLELGGVQKNNLSLSNFIPFMDNDKIFLITSDNNCSYINMYDSAGEMLSKVKVDCRDDIKPQQLDYNSLNSTISISDFQNKTLSIYNTETNESEIINLPFPLFGAHYIEQKQEWVFLSSELNSNKEFRHKIIYTNSDFEKVHEILVPSENSNNSRTRTTGFKIVEDKVYFNTWGSNSIYMVNNHALDKVYEVPSDYRTTRGILAYFISTDFIYVTMGSNLGMPYSIYFDRNNINTYFMPLGTVLEPITTEDYRFFNIEPQANSRDDLYLSFTKESYDICISSPVGGDKLNKFPNNYGSGTDLVLFRYKIDTDFLESISTQEIPVYLQKNN